MWANAPQFPRSLFAAVLPVGIAGVAATCLRAWGSAKRNAASLARACRIPQMARAWFLVNSPVTCAVSTAPLGSDFRLLANTATGGLGSLLVIVPDLAALFQRLFLLVPIEIGFTCSTAPMTSDDLGTVGITAFRLFLSLLATWLQLLPWPFYAVIAMEDITGSTALAAIDFFRRAIDTLAWFSSTHKTSLHTEKRRLSAGACF